MIDKLIKLASEVTDRLECLEQENFTLVNALQKAKNSMVNTDVVSKTVDKLCKNASVPVEDKARLTTKLTEDPTAIYQLVDLLIDAQTQSKTPVTKVASQNIDGGSLITDVVEPRVTNRENCLDTMIKILQK